ncbi:MAG: hypothetical protein LBF80_03195 [Spirochaetaceae bacterium]|nr:hypothetical protein [Spirochaetaceae bacterium]
MGMKFLRIYVENSVVGGYFDDEFKEHTRKLFDCVKFKYELQEKLLKKSGARNLREYVNYANKIYQKSTLHKIKEKVM